VHKYPFLDLRSSTFLFAITAVTAAIGVVGVFAALRRWLKEWTAIPIIVASVVAVAAFAVGAASYARIHSIPNEDERAQTLYVAAHARPSDVILVNLNSNWGFAYYWPVGQPARRTDPNAVQDYEAYFPGQPRIVVAFSRVNSGVAAGLSQAVRESRQRSCSPIWLIRTHVNSTEAAAWRASLQNERLTATPVGVAGLTIINVRRSLCQ